MEFVRQIYDSEVEKVVEHLARGDDIGATVAALDECKHPTQVQKSHIVSYNFRKIGNDFFKKNDYHASLNLYNAAIASAPTGSLALKFAYANRSAVFYELKKFDACVKDIDTCESLGYPAKKLAKLRDRKNNCLEMMKHNQVIDQANHEAATNFFGRAAAANFEDKNLYKEVSVEGITHLESKKCYKPGEIVIITEPIISVSARQCSLVCCSYCLRYTENLIPCPTCCYILFCNATCLKKCYAEYHKIECAIMHLYSGCYEKYWANIRLAIKQRISEGSWEKYIENNQVTKPDKIIKARLSLLLEKTLFDAVAIHNIDAKTDFFKDPNLSKLTCIRGFIQRINSIHEATIGIKSLIIEKLAPACNGNTIGTNTMSLTALDSKLKHACNANLVPMFVNNKIYLIAKTPIAKGETFTITYGISYPNSTKEFRQVETYRYRNIVCDCSPCLNNWECPDEPPSLNAKELINNIKYVEACGTSDPRQQLRLICEGVDAFHSEPCSYWFSIYNQLLYGHIMNYLAIVENHYTSGNKGLYQLIVRQLQYVKY